MFIEFPEYWGDVTFYEVHRPTRGPQSVRPFLCILRGETKGCYFGVREAICREKFDVVYECVDGSIGGKVVRGILKN